jgi:hypothetical protein
VVWYNSVEPWCAQKLQTSKVATSLGILLFTLLFTLL